MLIIINKNINRGDGFFIDFIALIYKFLGLIAGFVPDFRNLT